MPGTVGSILAYRNILFRNTLEAPRSLRGSVCFGSANRGLNLFDPAHIHQPVPTSPMVTVGPLYTKNPTRTRTLLPVPHVQAPGIPDLQWDSRPPGRLVH
jgi:hypothetical protein